MKNDFLYTTMETDIHSEERAMTYMTSEPKEKQKTKVMEHYVADTADEMEKATDTKLFATTPVVEHESEPSTSGDSFGRLTGLLANDRTQEGSTKLVKEVERTRPSMTSESKEDDHSSEESKYPMPTKTNERLTKTISMTRGKIIQTEMYDTVPSKSYLMNQSSQKELTQGEKQPDSETKESDN